MEDMDNKTIENDILTKDNGALTSKTPVTLSPTDAAEYRAYKKEKKMLEINEAIGRSESVVGAQDDAVRVMERASRIRQAAIRVTPSRFLQVKEYLMRGSVKVDCVIGGDGSRWIIRCCMALPAWVKPPWQVSLPMKWAQVSGSLPARPLRSPVIWQRC